MGNFISVVSIPRNQSLVRVILIIIGVTLSVGRQVGQTGDGLSAYNVTRLSVR